MNGLIAVLLIALVTAVTSPGKADSAERGLQVEVELLDSVKCWCSPLWGHNAPKIVEGRNGEIFVALFSGEYPEATVQILKRNTNGQWQRGKKFSGAYQPSLLFVDGEGRLNVVQNSQTKPLIHFRSTDDANLENFGKVAEGNGQADGRGWYVGAGVHNDTIYMSYILLSYDLFLTWKRVSDPVWHPPVLVHKGLVDTVKGNHSWTRPRFQFAGRKGFFVVNETSDGSVKNTYNAVQLVTFNLSDPRRFSTECIERVPTGFGAYSPDFGVSEGGWLHCVIERNPRIYESPFKLDGETGVFVYSRAIDGKEWTASRVFSSMSDGALLVGRPGPVTVLRVLTAGSTVHADRTENVSAGKSSSWQALQSDNHGTDWGGVQVSAAPKTYTTPSHIQVITGANSAVGFRGSQGVFEDNRGTIPGTKLSAYGIYYFRVAGGNTH